MVKDIIYNQSCEDTMANLSEDSVDVILTSPPYNMTSRKGGNADTGRYDVYRDWKSEEEYIQWTVDIFDGFNKVLKPNGAIIYNFNYSVENPSLPYKLITAICNNTPFTLVDTIMWKKSNGMPFAANRTRLSRIWEFVWIITRKREVDSFNCYKGISKVGKQGQNYYNIVYNIVEAKNNDGDKQKLNQATYSSELCNKLLSIYSKEGDVIYDPFMGTGTTGVACVETNRHYIGSEISTAQCQYAEERIEKVKLKFD